MAHGEFVVVQPDVVLPPVEQVMSFAPEPRFGDWQEFEQSADEVPFPSLRFAQTLQSLIGDYCLEQQHELISESANQLDELALDIRSKRVAVRLDDGHISGNIGGYTITRGIAPGDKTGSSGKTVVALRINELAYGIKQRADYNSEGRRLAGPEYVPVLAVRGLALINRLVGNKKE